MDTQVHFDTIANSYQTVRYTDHEPIEYIVARIGEMPSITGVDFGSGTGRYSILLAQTLPQLHLTCVDASGHMLAELRKNFSKAGISNFAARRATIKTVTLPANRFHAIFTFNAVHHFNLALFLRRCASWLHPGGHLFIYTRLRQQNAKSVWGRYFPLFTHKEDRLYTMRTIESAVQETPHLSMVEHREFCYERQGNLATLLQKVDQAHYSTFRLYTPQELRTARQQFIRRLRKVYANTERITWCDFNIMLHVRATHS